MFLFKWSPKHNINTKRKTLHSTMFLFKSFASGKLQRFRHTLHSTMFLFKSVPSNSPHTLPKSTLFCRPLSCFPFIYTYSPLIIHLNTIKSKKKSHHCQPTILLALSHIDNTIKRNLFCPPLFPTFLYPAIFPDGF